MRLSYNEQREYDALPGEIELLDKKLEGMHDQISKGGSDFAKLQSLMNEQETLEMELLEKMERLEHLEKIFETSQNGYK